MEAHRVHIWNLREVANEIARNDAHAGMRSHARGEERTRWRRSRKMPGHLPHGH